jgi:hypothetical protein
VQSDADILAASEVASLDETDPDEEKRSTEQMALLDKVKLRLSDYE